MNYYLDNVKTLHSLKTTRQAIKNKQKNKEKKEYEEK